MPSSVPRKDTDTLANGIISNEITRKVIKMWIDILVRDKEVPKEVETPEGCFPQDKVLFSKPQK